MLALLPAGDADRWFTTVFVGGTRLELTEPSELGESEIGIDDAVRGQFVRDYRELGDIRCEKVCDGLTERSERTPIDGCPVHNFTKKSLERFDEFACAFIHRSRLVVAVGSGGGEHGTATCPPSAQVVPSCR